MVDSDEENSFGWCLGFDTAGVNWRLQRLRVVSFGGPNE